MRCALAAFYGGYTLESLRHVPWGEVTAMTRYMQKHYEAMGG